MPYNLLRTAASLRSPLVCVVIFAVNTGVETDATIYNEHV